MVSSLHFSCIPSKWRLRWPRQRKWQGAGLQEQSSGSEHRSHLSNILPLEVTKTSTGLGKTMRFMWPPLRTYSALEYLQIRDFLSQTWLPVVLLGRFLLCRHACVIPQYPLRNPISDLEMWVLLSMLVMVKGEKALYHCTLRLQIGRNSCPPHQSSFLHQIPKCLIKLNHIHSSPPGIDTHWHPPCISEEAAMNGFPSLLQLFPSLAIMSPTAIATYSPHPCAGIFFFFFQEIWASPFTQQRRHLSLPLPFDHLSAASSRSATHLLALPPPQPKPLPSGDDLFVYLDSKLSRAGTVSNCMFVPYLQLCWTEYTHCHLLLETKFLLGVSSTEK